VQANWFIALRVLGGEFLAGVAAPAQVRVFAPEDLHITLAFLGKVGEERALQSFAHATAVPLAALSTSLGEVVALGSRRRPSAFSALPIAQRGQIEAAMSAVRDVLCDAAGAARETRPALAHVTLARPSRRATSAEIAVAKTWAADLTRAAPRVRIASVALYTWSEDRARKLFRIVAEAPLPPA
jgi:RNA 2',3'-cyclic 3'-phosphodiesterase